MSLPYKGAYEGTAHFTDLEARIGFCLGEMMKFFIFAFFESRNPTD